MFNDLLDSIGQFVWVIIVVAAVGVGIATLLLRGDSGTDLQTLELTLNAVATQSNAYVPTLTTRLSQTPPAQALTGAAPTLSLAGRQEARMFAAAAEASSEADTLRQGAVQATGPPDTPECGDFTTAWATKKPDGTGSITLLYPELVTPTGVQVFQTFNPGFIIRIDFIDIYGDIHTIYESTPQPRNQCPFTLVVAIQDADYKGNRLTIYVDQTTSTGGWNQIDAVQLIGIKHN